MNNQTAFKEETSEVNNLNSIATLHVRTSDQPLPLEGVTDMLQDKWIWLDHDCPVPVPKIMLLQRAQDTRLKKASMSLKTEL